MKWEKNVIKNSNDWGNNLHIGAFNQLHGHTFWCEGSFINNVTLNNIIYLNNKLYFMNDVCSSDAISEKKSAGI